MTQEPTFAGRLGGDLRLLFQSAIVIFLVTVIIGILNGVDAVDFSHDALLTHVHAGTLGWITLAVFATTFWLFSEGEALSAREAAQAHQLSLAAIGAMALYVLAFATGNGIFRPWPGPSPCW
jgi:cbb3-type cytochrome oxidase subunit 1